MQYQFGVGSLVLIPSGSNPTPVQVGTLQEATIDVEKTVKELYGAYNMPVAVGEGPLKISGTAKAGNINGALIAATLAGSTVTTGAAVRAAANESGTIPGSPYAITVTNSATWTVDGGVYNVTAQKPMTRVASGPATGQYSVAAGVYTFAAADTTNVVWITYYYTSSTGNTVNQTNQLMGGGTEFGCRLFNFSQGKYAGIYLRAVRLTKLAFPFKNEDFMVNDLAFTAYADSSGVVADFFIQE